MKTWRRCLSIALAAALTVGTGYTVYAAAGGPDAEILTAMLAELKSLNASLVGQPRCCPVVENAHLSEGLVVNPLEASTHTLVSVSGPGKFVSARLTKQGGASGLTFVTLSLDGQVIESRSVVAFKNIGLTEDNPYGIMVNTSAAGIDVVTIGFPQTLSFKSKLELPAPDNEPGVVQMIGTVITGN